MGTVDNIYVLNDLISRQLGKTWNKMTMMFADLKAALDSVDRKVLIKMMRERGIREGMVKKVGEVVRETKSSVGVDKE